MSADLKIKELKKIKKNLLNEKKSLNTILENIRENKKSLQKQLSEQKKSWKDNLTKYQEIETKIVDISKILKDKKVKGKRGFKLSGLSIDIKNKLEPDIIEFFNLNTDDKITRIMVMKQLFNYIETNSLHIDGDKRYLDLNKDVEDLLNIYKIDRNNHPDNKIRVQKFRFYLENKINKN